MKRYDPDDDTGGRMGEARRRRIYCLVAGIPAALALGLLVVSGEDQNHLWDWVWEPSGVMDAIRCLLLLSLLVLFGVFNFYHATVTHDDTLPKMDNEGGVELPPGCVMFLAFGVALLFLLRWVGVLLL